MEKYRAVLMVSKLMVKLGVLISGGGTNLQAIIDACQAGDLDAEVAIVISNAADAYGLERARQAGIEYAHLTDDADILEALADHEVDLVILAGYLKLVTQPLIEAYPSRILNIHPSLIPSFSGKDYYGLNVHQAAIDRGVKVSGVTVHRVNENFDEGEILAQEIVPVLEEDTAEDLQQRVLKIEHQIYVDTIKKVIQDLGE